MHGMSKESTCVGTDTEKDILNYFNHIFHHNGLFIFVYISLRQIMSWDTLSAKFNDLGKINVIFIF